MSREDRNEPLGIKLADELCGPRPQTITSLGVDKVFQHEEAVAIVSGKLIGIKRHAEKHSQWSGEINQDNRKDGLVAAHDIRAALPPDVRKGFAFPLRSLDE